MTALLAESASDLDWAAKACIAERVAALKQRHGFPDHPPFEMPAALHETEEGEAEPRQLSLLPLPAVPHAGGPPCANSVPSMQGHPSIGR
jgi:hypothetical protein